MMEALSPGRELAQPHIEIAPGKPMEEPLVKHAVASHEETHRNESLKGDVLHQEIIRKEEEEQESFNLENTTKRKNIVRRKKNASSSPRKKRGVKKTKKTHVTCDVCGKQFRDNHNLNRHYETKHGECYVCNMCSAVYNTERKLQRHMKKHMPLKERAGNPFTCTECSRVFRDKHNMKTHQCFKTYKKSACIYPGCDLQFYHVTKMLKHVEKDHESKIDTLNFTFESEDLFQRWKEEEELASFAHFSKRSGTVDSDCGSFRCYVCQANGESINCPRKTAKRWKKGKVRMGKLCPSRMLVKEVNGKITVKYIVQHSHDRSIKNDKLPVPKSVKTYAKNLLLMGASPQQVRKSVCEGLYGGNSIIPQGGYVISNRYFFDLKKKLENKPGSTTDEEKEKYDPVFVYKPQGHPVVVGDDELDKLPCSNDLFAIGIQTKEQCLMMKKRAHKILCVISAQTYNLYGFEILTLVVPDVFGHGYPVAHFLTSHIDEVTLRLLFLCLRTRCPNVKIRSVMTDDDVNIFNSISSVFGNTKHYVCHWFVKKCWEDEMNKNCCTNQSDLCSSLNGILNEKSKSVFKLLCNSFVEKYSDHNPDFVKYFLSKFLTRPDIWAMCYRQSSHSISNPQPYTNINMHCEYFHNRLKAFIANECLSQRVADMGLLLLNIQEGHYLQYKEQLLKGTRVRSAASGKHYNGLSIDDGNVSHLCGMWSVKSRCDMTVEYTVTKKHDSCGRHDCFEMCHEALCENLCNHLYRCSCDDRVELCEHIHKVHSLTLRQEKSSCIPSALKVKPRNIEFILSELSENIDNNNVNYITVIKKEKDDFMDTDLDFVRINIDERIEQVEILERESLVHKEEGSLQGKSVKQENTGSVGKQRIQKRKCSASSKYNNSEKSVTEWTNYIQKENIQQHKNGSKIQTVKMERAISKSQPPTIKIERVDDTEDNEPLVRIKRIFEDSQDKELRVKCESEVEESPEKVKRAKRPHNGSVVQAAIENKKRRLEPSLKDIQLKTEDSLDDDCSDEDVGSMSVINKQLKNLKCKHCSGVFRDRYNLDRHIQNKHATRFSYTCKLCSAVFKTKLRFDKHVKKHNDTKAVKSVQCAECLRMFRDQYNMKLHKCAKARKRSLCIYPECDMQFYHMTHMVRHLELDHDDKIDCNNMHFESEKLFQAWKEEEEALSLAVFNKRNGTLGSDNVRYSYYVCQAGGDSVSASKTQRRWKNKIRTGKACPSRMLVKEKGGKITVKYISYHSHDVKDDFKKYPPLPKYVKELGKQLLLMGVSPKRVRERIQDGVLLNGNQVVPKKYAVKNRFFYDMKKRLERKGCVFTNETEKNSETIDQNANPIDLSALMVSRKHLNYDTLLVYKPIGCPVTEGDRELDSLPFSKELFAFGLQTKAQNEMMREGSCKIVCIKSYFDVSTDGFQLINFAVPDKYGSGFPIAHFVTNRVDEKTLTALFRSLKKRCPNLKFQALMSDDDLCIFNAIRAVFGEVYHFICHGYVKQCWLEKIDQLVENEDDKADIPFYLMDILYERDEGHFQSRCRNFVDMYSKISTEFTLYFVDFYLARPEVWAMYYRQDIFGINYPELFSNVNLHCEHLHNRLKSLSVSGKFPQRVTELVALLLKVETEYNLLYRKNAYLSVPINCSASGRHYCGLEIDDKDVSNSGGDTWTVISRFDKSIKYTVNVVEINCNRIICHEKCTEFLCIGLCNHLYVCSCEDRADLCEHIHKVHSLKLKLDKPSDVETLTGDRESSIQVIVYEGLEDVPPFERLTVEVDLISDLDPSDDRVVYHEIVEI